MNIQISDKIIAFYATDLAQHLSLLPIRGERANDVVHFWEILGIYNLYRALCKAPEIIIFIHSSIIIHNKNQEGG